MVMWHLPQVAPIRSGHSVTVIPPEVQIPCDRATEPTLRIPRILLSDHFLTGLINFPGLEETEKNKTICFICCVIKVVQEEDPNAEGKNKDI